MFYFITAKKCRYVVLIINKCKKKCCSASLNGKDRRQREKHGSTENRESQFRRKLRFFMRSSLIWIEFPKETKEKKTISFCF